MTPEWFTAWATAAGAGATFLAVVAALGIAIWGDWLRSLTSRPKLSVSISMTAPDCHKIQTTGQVQLPGTAAVVQIAAFETYYCRLSVGNEGTAAARNVSVRAIRLSKLNALGGYDADPYFMPMNLTWSHAGGSTEAGKIDPNLPRHCDLCHVDYPTRSHLQFNTEVTPNQVAHGVWPTVKPAGTYRMEVGITADNAEPLHRILKVDFKANWFATEADMFSKGLTVAVENA